MERVALRRTHVPHRIHSSLLFVVLRKPEGSPALRTCEQGLIDRSPMHIDAPTREPGLRNPSVPIPAQFTRFKEGLSLRYNVLFIGDSLSNTIPPGIPNSSIVP
ncbi:unnamed protein product [Allacma fusca]|uniref:Uncharacterized protein n=1 Tax=Allacma fusca TaxID=39272 RepID=A0A8J2P9M2_9HEXA|nr:unnamed protein product [Allacma fusca]